MFIKNLIHKTNKLLSLGNRIVSNYHNKQNLYSIPPKTYEDYSRHQEELIQEYIDVVDKLHKEVERNKDKFDEFKLGPF